MNEYEELDRQENLIHRFFRYTLCGCPYDDLGWDGETLEVVLNDVTIETYTKSDLIEIIPGFDDDDQPLLSPTSGAHTR